MQLTCLPNVIWWMCLAVWTKGLDIRCRIWQLKADYIWSYVFLFSLLYFWGNVAENFCFAQIRNCEKTRQIGSVREKFSRWEGQWYFCGFWRRVGSYVMRLRTIRHGDKTQKKCIENILSIDFTFSVSWENVVPNPFWLQNTSVSSRRTVWGPATHTNCSVPKLSCGP